MYTNSLIEEGSQVDAAARVHHHKDTAAETGVNEPLAIAAPAGVRLPLVAHVTPDDVLAVALGTLCPVARAHKRPSRRG